MLSVLAGNLVGIDLLTLFICVLDTSKFWLVVLLFLLFVVLSFLELRLLKLNKLFVFIGVLRFNLFLCVAPFLGGVLKIDVLWVKFCCSNGLELLFKVSLKSSTNKSSKAVVSVEVVILVFSLFVLFPLSLVFIEFLRLNIVFVS